MLADVKPDAHADPELLALKLIAYSNLNKSEDAAACRAALGKINNSVATAWLLLIPRLTSAVEVDNRKIIAACRAPSRSIQPTPISTSTLAMPMPA